ncbi:MAG TPA: DUF6492 family protein [Pseudolysinimonas sp.]|nr:DUF6492 family protein [Pseudolysinimonas sp.]
MTSTFVTVVFEPELPLLELQARSMAKFLDPAYIARIIVLDNTDTGISARAWKRVIREYGSLADRVELVGSTQLAGAMATSGWLSQQVLKLAVSSIVHTPSYVTLDAKNHFVRPSGLSDFEAADGRAFGNFHGYETHPHRSALERVLEYEGLDPARFVSRFGATATPFTLYTDRVAALMADVERRSGTEFSTEFIRARLTEYFLYSAWLVAQGETLEELYDPSGVDCPAIWPRGATVEGVTAALNDVRERDPALFSVHRTALAKMNSRAAATLGGLWVERGLFESASQARSFVRRYRARYFPLVAMKKLRDRRTSR